MRSSVKENFGEQRSRGPIKIRFYKMAKKKAAKKKAKKTAKRRI